MRPWRLALARATLETMEQQWRTMIDEIGPHQVVLVAEPSIRLEGFVVIDNTAAGPAIGGLRMTETVTVAEVARLARAMTLKSAAAHLPHGGAKAGIVADSKRAPADKECLVRAFARHIGELASYIPGPDMGTDETAMAWVHDEIGRAVGRPAVLGGIPLDELGATAFGVIVAARAAADALDIDMSASRAVVQGFGAVGRPAARLLAEGGATVVAVADSKGVAYAPDGLDLGAVEAHRADSGTVSGTPGSRPLSPAELVALECDIWVPAAGPDVFTAANAHEVKARLVVSGANIPATHDAESILAERGVVVVPDFIANAGGLICAAVEHRGGAAGEVFALIEEQVGTNTKTVLAQATNTDTTPRTAATALAHARVVEADGYRRRC